MRGHTRRTAGAWALALWVAAGSHAFAEENTQAATQGAVSQLAAASPIPLSRLEMK